MKLVVYSFFLSQKSTKNKYKENKITMKLKLEFEHLPRFMGVFVRN